MNYENEYEALRLTIERSRKSYKEAAVFIFPHLKHVSAYARLLNSLNPDKDEKLSFKEIIDLCNFCKNYDALYYMAYECGFEKPNLLRIEDIEKLMVTNLSKMKKDFGIIFNMLEKMYVKKSNI